MKVGDLVKRTRDCDYQPQIFRRGMVGIVESTMRHHGDSSPEHTFVDVRVSGAGDRPVVSYLAMDLEVINESR
jgi:hypothetical protein